MRAYGYCFILCSYFLLTGCIYYPFTYHTLEADHIQQPFTQLWMVTDPGNLSLSVHDSAHDLRTLHVLRANFKTESGEAIPIEKIDYDKIYGRDFAIVKFYYKKGAYINEASFSASIQFSVDGKELSVDGTFSTHSHTKIEYLPEVLDHG